MSIGMKLVWVAFALCWVGLFLLFKWIDMYVTNIPAEIMQSMFVNDNGELNMLGVFTPTMVPGYVLLYIVTMVVLAFLKKITWKEFLLFGGTLVLFCLMIWLTVYAQTR